MKRFVIVFAMAIFAGLYLNCSSTKPPGSAISTSIEMPKWMNEFPFVGNPDIIEARGAAPNHPDIREMRTNALKAAMQELDTQLGGRVTFFSEDYSRNFSDYYRGGNTGGRLDENLLRIDMENEIGRNYVAGEWHDPRTGNYWRYVYMPLASLDEIALRKKQEEAERNEMILEMQKDAFIKRMQEERARTIEEKKQQEKEFRAEYERKMKGGGF